MSLVADGTTRYQEAVRNFSRAGDLLVLDGPTISQLLAQNREDLIKAVGDAYIAHGSSKDCLPHSTFLLPPGNSRNRIIALPAYLDDDVPVTGIKWISSFPGNLDRGMERASAVVVLNCALTGRPVAFLEGSVISAQRTAASAVLAAEAFTGDDEVASVSLVGCGLINLEILRFLRSRFSLLSRVVVYDTNRARAEELGHQFVNQLGGASYTVANDAQEALRGARLVSFATTAATPHIHDVSGCEKDAVLLHVSLRDLSPEVVLSCDNIVDDADHVCRASTSLHLAEMQCGNRDFIRAPISKVLTNEIAARNGKRTVIFSPFGLGVLDLAVARLCVDMALAQGRGTLLKGFLPATTKNGNQTSQK
jgi:ornithine cyclodeaminase